VVITGGEGRLIRWLLNTFRVEGDYAVRKDYFGSYRGGQATSDTQDEVLATAAFTLKW